MIAAAILFTIPTVLLIPRARQSPIFDRLLWVATVAVAFLGAWAALGYVAGSPDLAGWSSYRVGEVPVVPIVAGAAGGALLLNVILWLMDRFVPAEELEEEEFASEEKGPPATSPDEKEPVESEPVVSDEPR